MHIDEFVSHFKKPRKTPTGFQCLCPAHDDDNASLSVAVGTTGNIVVKCHAGCSSESVVTAAGLKMSDLFTGDKNKDKIYHGTTTKKSEWKYYDLNGKYVYSAMRLDIPGKPKKMWMQAGNKKSLNGIKRILYNIQNVQEAIVNEDIIFIVEGEKQVENLKKLGLTGTTNPQGAEKWNDSYSMSLTWAITCILPDNDHPGQMHGKKVAGLLYGVVKSIKIIDLPGLKSGEDVSEWIEYGGTKEQLLELYESTPFYKPEENPADIIYYYDRHRKEYLYHNKRCWISLNEGQFKKNLVSSGYSDKKQKHEELTEVDKKLIELREHNDVDYVGALAGYPKGFYNLDENKLLITNGPKIIYPKEGKFEVILKVIENLLVKEDDFTQFWFFVYWLKMAYESLVSKCFRTGQILILAGEAASGKSLLQSIITEIIGGRSARPYKFMTDKTEFNADLFFAEHLIIEDEIAMVDIRSRREFGNKLKQFAANPEHRCRAMYRDAIVLKPFWRVSISLNDEPENLMILPPLDDSMLDKMIILRAYKKPMPMPTAKNEDRVKFWTTIKSELPAFIYFITKTEILEEFTDERYGIKQYHNDYIISELDQLSPEKRLLDLIDIVFFPDAIEAFEIINMIEMTAHEIEMKLRDDNRIKHEVAKLLPYNTTCGTYLSRLAKKSRRVENIRKVEKRLWKIIRKGFEK